MNALHLRACEDKAMRRQLQAKETLGKTNPASTLILAFQPPEPRENKCLFLNHKDPWYLLNGGETNLI